MIWRGRYRDQSSATAIDSLLDAEERPVPDGVLRDHDVDRALATVPSWQGRFRVRLSPLQVRRRTGGFAGEDALYYAARFTPAPRTQGLDANVLDLVKLGAHLERRKPALALLLDAETHALLEHELGEALWAGWEEYLCHEAGHGHGFDVESKLASGFFRPNGCVAWPLVFAEEHRADLLSLGFAARLLPPARARRLFAFHLVHRFGLLVDQLAKPVETEGLQAFLLFASLARHGAAAVRDGRLSLLARPSAWRGTMLQLAASAERAFEGRDPGIECALAMARYLRALREDPELARAYRGLALTTRKRLEAAPCSPAARRRAAPRAE